MNSGSDLDCVRLVGIVVEALGPSEEGLNQEHGKVVLFDLAAVGYVHPKFG